MENKVTDLLTVIVAGGIVFAQYLLSFGMIQAEEAVKAWGMRLIIAALIAIR